MCEVCESNAEQDGLHQVYPNYGYFQCITPNCKKCGTDNVLMKILRENPGIVDCTDKITYDWWEWVPNERTGTCRLDLVTHPEMKMKLFNQY